MTSDWGESIGLTTHRAPGHLTTWGSRVLLFWAGGEEPAAGEKKDI
jgi:hypothetical protein